MEGRLSSAQDAKPGLQFRSSARKFRLEMRLCGSSPTSPPPRIPDHTYPTFPTATWNLHTASANREIKCPWVIRTTNRYAFPSIKLVQFLQNYFQSLTRISCRRKRYMPTVSHFLAVAQMLGPYCCQYRSPSWYCILMKHIMCQFTVWMGWHLHKEQLCTPQHLKRLCAAQRGVSFEFSHQKRWSIPQGARGTALAASPGCLPHTFQSTPVAFGRWRLLHLLFKTLF